MRTRLDVATCIWTQLGWWGTSTVPLNVASGFKTDAGTSRLSSRSTRSLFRLLGFFRGARRRASALANMVSLQRGSAAAARTGADHERVCRLDWADLEDISPMVTCRSETTDRLRDLLTG